jgi:nitrogen regulatory protein PII
VIGRINTAARTGRMGDGKVFVLPATEAVFPDGDRVSAATGNESAADR